MIKEYKKYIEDGRAIIPMGLTEIAAYAFVACKVLTSVEIPNSVTEICDGAFLSCRNLANIEIPNSVCKIGHHAFGHCTSLTIIGIPNSVTEIGASVFSECKSLSRIIVDNRNPTYTSNGNCLISKADKRLIRGCQHSIIPYGVKEIDRDAFSDCESITSIEIPDSVSRIGPFAFYNCKSLVDIRIGNNVQEVGACAFSGCNALISIEIPNSVSKIGNGAFSGCCALSDIILRFDDPNNAPLNGDSFSIEQNELSDITLHVPIGAGYAYRHHPFFCQFKEVIASIR